MAESVVLTCWPPPRMNGRYQYADPPGYQVRQFRFRQLWHHRNCRLKCEYGPADSVAILLYTMAAGLKLETAIHRRHPLILAITSLKPPCSPSLALAISTRQRLRFGVTAVHAEQVSGEQCCLITARSGADFHKRVTLVVWIFRQRSTCSCCSISSERALASLQLFLRHFAHSRIKSIICAVSISS